jgi:transcriptional regulator with XRE-family HTH domain
VGARKELPRNYRLFFRDLGKEIKAYRAARKWSQEDMIFHGFTVRSWQRMESGEPFTVVTLLRVCEAFDVSIAHLRKSKGRGSPSVPNV